MISHKRSLFKASVIIGVAIIFSRVLGLIREQYTLYLFGASWNLDAYVSAYKIPNLLRNLLGEGAFSVVFISIFSKLHNNNKKEALEFANQVLSYLFLISFVVSLIVLFFTPTYMAFLHKSTINFNLTVNLSRIMVFFINFISLAAIFMGILNSQQRFFIPAIAPAIGNVINILLIVLFHHQLGVYVLALGFLTNAFVLMVIQIPFVFNKEFRFSFNFKMTSKLKYFFKAFFPVAFGMAFFQINQLLSNSFSSQVQGGNTVMDKSFLIIQMAIAILSAGISTALLPIISRADGAAEKTDIYFDSVRASILLIFPCSILFFILGPDISEFIYYDIFKALGLGLGKISLSSVREIGQVISLFAPGITLYSLITMANRAFQGMNRYGYPVIGSALSTVINIFLMKMFFHEYGLRVLPIAINIAAFFNLTALMFLLRRFMTKNHKGLNYFFLRQLIAGCVLFVIVYYARNLVFIHFNNLVRLPLLGATGFLSYLIMLFFLKDDNIHQIYAFLKRRKS